MREVIVRTHSARRAADAPDFALVFDKMPGLCLVLDPSFTIVAQNEEHARATQADVGERRPPKADKTVQWTVLSRERRSGARARRDAGTPRARASGPGEVR
jgi:hypothetical protein